LQLPLFPLLFIKKFRRKEGMKPKLKFKINQKHFKIKCFIITIAILLPMLAGCFGNKNNESEVNDPNAFNAIIDSVEFKINSLNNGSGSDSITAYDRNYKANDTFSYKIGGDHSDRIILVIEEKKSFGVSKYQLTNILIDENPKNDTLIPVNGIVISISKSALSADKLNAINAFNEYSDVSINNYNQKPVMEDLTRCILSVSSVERKINLKNPDTNVIPDNSIIYINNEYSKSFIIPENTYAMKIEKVVSTTFKFVETVTGQTEPGNIYLIFYGNYNIEFGKQLCSGDEKLAVNNLNMVSSTTDQASIVIDENEYSLVNGDVDQESISGDGIYLFDANNSSRVSPETNLDFIEMVVIDNEVLYIGDANEKVMIPNNNGFAISFVGSAIEKASQITLGDTIKTQLLDIPDYPEKYVRIGKSIFSSVGYNQARDNSTLVVYTSEFGEATGTDDTGTEVIVVNNKVTEIKRQSGNNQIPENGYVISIGSSHDRYSFIFRAAVGEAVYTSLISITYNMAKLPYNSINGVRNTNYLVVYDGSDGKKTTETNEWGIEVIVNANGQIVGFGEAGNTAIPEGGLILSGHEDMKNELIENYILGAKVIIDKANKNVIIFDAPETKADTSFLLLEGIQNKFDNAKENLLDLNYNEVEGYIDEIKNLINQAKQLYTDGKFEQSIMTSETANTMLVKANYMLNESFMIENRAAWYRPVEKTEADVEATVKKAKELNLTAIYVETWYDGYTIFDKIDSEYVIKNPMYGDLDVLEAFLKFGKQYGIEIHCWVESYFVGVQGSNNPTLLNMLDLRVLSKSGLNYYPVIGDDGKEQKYIFFDPYNTKAQQIVLDVYESLINNYDIDGLNHDYIRFPDVVNGTDDYGYNDDIIAGFQAEYNTDKDPKTFIKGSQDWKNWCQFRENIINDFVYKIDQVIKDSGKDISVSCALFPNVEEAKTTIFQNAKAWVDAGLIDEAFTMSYFLDVPSVEANAKTVSKLVGEEAFFTIGIAAFIKVETNTFCDQITAIRKYSGTGVAIFSLNALLGSQYVEPLTAGQFSRESVPGYKYDQVIIRGSEDFIRRIVEVYSVLKPESKTKLDELSVMLSDLQSIGEDFVSSKETSIDKQIEAINSWIASLDDMTEFIKSAGFDDSLKKAFNEDIDQLHIYLSRSVQRLTIKSGD